MADANMVWEERLSRYLHIPTDFSAEPFPVDWIKPIKHIGASEHTPLKQALTAKHQGGLYALMSGVLIWTAARLQNHTDVQPLQELSVALFLFQQDPAYYRHPEERPKLRIIDSAEKYQATVMWMLHSFYEDWFWFQQDWTLYPTFSTVAEIICLARHHMGSAQRAVFDPWVEGMIARIADIAAYPEAKDLPDEIPEADRAAQRLTTMGPAIPPQTLDLTLDLSTLDFQKAWIEFLTSVDWASNRFLKPPDEIHLSIASGRAYAVPR